MWHRILTIDDLPEDRRYYFWQDKETDIYGKPMLTYSFFCREDAETVKWCLDNYMAWCLPPEPLPMI
jgi:hypothetical protein